MKTNRKALIIDDYIFTQNLLKLFFSELKWQPPTIVETGEEALKILETEIRNFDVIILDQKLPGISGLKTFQLAKKSFDELPAFIMISGNLDSTLETAAKEIGINNFIYKDELDLELFEKLLKEVLQET